MRALNETWLTGFGLALLAGFVALVTPAQTIAHPTSADALVEPMTLEPSLPPELSLSSDDVEGPATCSGGESPDRLDLENATPDTVAVACVKIWLTPRSPYMCCAGRGWMSCQALS